MDDLISRQAAIDVASGYCHPANIADELRKLPSAQPERKKGRWRNIQIGKWLGVECTACKIARDRREVPHDNGGIVVWKFCPECGADMRGLNDEVN